MCPPTPELLGGLDKPPLWLSNDSSLVLVVWVEPPLGVRVLGGTGNRVSCGENRLILQIKVQTLLKMGRYCSTAMCHYWDMSVK